MNIYYVSLFVLSIILICISFLTVRLVTKDSQDFTLYGIERTILRNLSRMDAAFLFFFSELEKIQERNNNEFRFDWTFR